MEIVVINKTKVSTAKLKSIISFVKPKNTIIPPIRVRRVKSVVFYGAYYYPTGKKRRIYASVGQHTNFPYFVEREASELRMGYLGNFWLKNQEEALVYLLAHELRHSFQEQNPKAERLGSKYRNRLFSETDCDTYAILQLERWRKKNERLKKRVKLTK